MRTSLRWQLILQIALTLFVALICINIYSVYKLQIGLTNVKVGSTSNQIYRMGQELDTLLAGFVQSLESYGHVIHTSYSDNFTNSSTLKDQLANITKQMTINRNSNVCGYWFIMDSSYKNQGAYFAWYGIKQGQMRNLSYTDIKDPSSPANTDIPYYDFYFAPKKNGATHFTNVYTNKYINRDTISVSLPVYDDNNELLGVAGMDIQLTGLEKMLDAIKIGKTGYAVLLSDSGKLLFHPNRKFINEQTAPIATDDELYAITLQTAEKTPSYSIHNYQGVESYFFSYPISVSGWKIVEIVPEADMNQPFVSALSYKLISLLLELVACAAIVYFWTTMTVVKPLRQLLNAAKKSEDGQQSEIVLSSGNEFRSLAIKMNRLFQIQKSYKEREEGMKRLNSLNVVGEMAAAVSHEIRNPMTTIRGFLQILRNKKEYQADLVYFDTMIEEVTRANNIITEYLTLAQNRLTEFKLNDLNGIIRSIHPLVQASAASDNHSIALELGDIPQIQLDEKEIRQLLHNLIRNGLEAMKECGVVTIRTVHEGGVVKLFVQDQGCGIDPHILKQLGTPFITSKETGTGLGMTICYNIVRRHNAALTVDTDSNGTTFAIEFPAAFDSV